MTESIRDRKDALIATIKELGTNTKSKAANLKFALLFKTRLMEENIPVDHALAILANTKFDLSNINEDDDYIGDVALQYAEVIKIHYDIIFKLFSMNGIKNFDVIAKQLALLDIKV